MKPSYLNLCTEFYDLTKPEAGLREVAFYEALLRASKGPVLEAMCGSGRLLIPLLRAGTCCRWRRQLQSYAEELSKALRPAESPCSTL